MYLQKLEIQGFKSFAQRTTLVFNRQLTAIVGPNGSGKSNIADAVRWVLGEQSLKLLRGKRSEDVIFAGSDQKGRLGMAEVSLFLNNEEGAGGVDFSEIVVTRRVFRDGQSEYLINNQAVRLQDVNLLLARANFGQKTYSVIGQGMVDSILISSPAERKEFFEEATGVKQYQLKREQAISKLVSTYENLEQAEVVITEIEPRLKILTRQVKRLEEREQLEQDLRKLQVTYYKYRYSSLESKRLNYESRLATARQALAKQTLQVREQQAKLAELEKSNNIVGIRAQYIKEQQKLQSSLTALYKEQAIIQANETVAHVKRGEGELALLKQRWQELQIEEKKMLARQAEVERLLKDQQARYKQALVAQTEITKGLAELESQTGDSWLGHELTIILDEYKEWRRKLLIVKTVAEVKTLAEYLTELESRLQGLIKKIDKKNGYNQSTVSDIIKQRELAAVELATAQAEVKRLDSEQQDLITRLQELKIVKQRVEQSLLNKPNSTITTSPVNDFKNRIAELENELGLVTQKLNELQTQTDARSAQVFATQRELSLLNTKEKTLEQEAHELELEIARLETKLDDLQVEMAGEVPPELVTIITSAGVAELIDETVIALEVQKLKRQWEATAGIEPEVVSEYQTTKTRYDFLTTQVTDLQTAAKQLEDIIRDLDKTIHQQFAQSFKVINQKFSEYFNILFVGGKAQLILQQADLAVESTQEVGDELINSESTMVAKPLTARERFLLQEKTQAAIFAGVDIQATPAGKKLSSMTALSGGEKALTSIALICAIISTHPSPFVVLDEVDAALDEANSERFAAILDSISHQTQFIAITHNRATMHRAHLLYGVTMGNDGVSKLLSIKLEEAEKTVKA